MKIIRNTLFPVILLLTLAGCSGGVRISEEMIPEEYVRVHLSAIAKSEGKKIVFVHGNGSYPAEMLPSAEKKVKAALENVRSTYVGNNIYGPVPPHLNRTIGSYTAACAWYEILFGEAPEGNSYIPPRLEPNPEGIEIARKCAHAGCTDPTKVSNEGFKNIKVIYDEKKLPDYTLPDPLRMENGEAVLSEKDWMEKRRPELLELFEREMFGKAPGRPEGLHFEVLYRDENALGGIGVRKEVKVHFDNTGEHYLKLLVYTPKSACGPVPLFLGINFKGNYGISSDEGILLPTEEEIARYGIVENLERAANDHRWPVERILEKGYGVATFYRGDIDPDYDDGFENGVHPLFYRKGQDHPEPDEWGTIAAWAWGLSRALDYLETDPDTDASRVAVIGHSRLGKTALWAGAKDERFKIIISNSSGNCGAALSRRRYGETPYKVNCYRPQWFCDNFQKYNKKEDSLPFDQHELIALSAPRPVYVASATEDKNADPKGEFLALRAASEVYRLFGKTGLDGVEMPAPDSPVGEGVLRYHIRTGNHDITPWDWEQYLSFADCYL